MTKEQLVAYYSGQCLLDPFLKSYLEQMPAVVTVRGQYLVHRCSEPGGLYFLAEGKAFSYHPGEAAIRAIYMPGDIIPGPPRGFGGEGFYYVGCFSPVRCYYLSRAKMSYYSRYVEQLGRLAEVAEREEGEWLRLGREIRAYSSGQFRLEHAFAVKPALEGTLSVGQLARYLGVGEKWLGRELTTRRMAMRLERMV